MPWNRSFEVITRPAGGEKVIVARCDDGLVHFFGFRGGRDVDPSPACGRQVGPSRAPVGDEAMMCDGCVACGESWAMGGDLRMRS